MIYQCQLQFAPEYLDQTFVNFPVSPVGDWQTRSLWCEVAQSRFHVDLKSNFWFKNNSVEFLPVARTGGQFRRNCGAPAERFLNGSLWDPTPERGVPWGSDLPGQITRRINVLYKQRFLTPGHQGWNDLHSLCRIGMDYYLLNNDDNNIIYWIMMIIMIMMMIMMTMMIIGTATIMIMIIIITTTLTMTIMKMIMIKTAQTPCQSLYKDRRI